MRYAAAALAGLLLTAAFPGFEWAWAAWLAPGLILFCALGTKGWQAFRIGFVGGLVHFLSSLYWLLNMPLTWHGLPLAPALGWLSLSAYCALYPALWVWLCWKIFPGEATMEQFLATGWRARLPWAFCAGAIWTALEYVRGTFLTGFPWNFVAASQYKMAPLIQVAAFTGILGVSFLVVWTSVSICMASFGLVSSRAGHTPWASAGVPILVVLGLSTLGLNSLAQAEAPPHKLKVAMIQPGIPQTEIWDESRDMARFQIVLDLSQKALGAKPRLLLWPESAVPDLSPEIQQTIAQFARANNLSIVFCAGTAEPTAEGTTAYYNSALICGPDGAIGGIYHKRRLVIFGEYVPLVRWLPFLKQLTDVGEQMAPGDRPVDFAMTDPAVKMSILICFEDMFPQEAREHAGPDIDFLVNLTNDGWFGHGAEQWQQAASAIFRAVENGVPLLRCTNDGLTCWADAQGRIRQIQSTAGNVYGAGYINAEIPLPAPGARVPTFYNRHGDCFSWACCAIGIGALGRAALGRRAPGLSVPKAPVDTAHN